MLEGFHKATCDKIEDHNSLRWLLFFKDLDGQLIRCLERFQRYEFEVDHRGGKSHRNADGLFRRLCEGKRCSYSAKRKTMKEWTNFGE
ncbi:hypothetical protein HZH68_014189 [Vespula germanica]|uniref:Uncharacterized protein n=1 Tax=Vespula germanica TaxID=30212 RepID=A0A834JAT7_VESGE|nr:hypothetical protein HZH68_014189 [Vespula germanica]